MMPSPMMAMAVKCFQRLKSNCMNVLQSLYKTLGKLHAFARERSVL